MTAYINTIKQQTTIPLAIAGIAPKSEPTAN